MDTKTNIMRIPSGEAFDSICDDVLLPLAEMCDDDDVINLIGNVAVDGMNDMPELKIFAKYAKTLIPVLKKHKENLFKIISAWYVEDAKSMSIFSMTKDIIAISKTEEFQKLFGLAQTMMKDASYGSVPTNTEDEASEVLSDTQSAE